MKWFVRAVVVIVLLGVAKGSLLYSIVEEQLQSRRSQNSIGKGCALDTFKHYNLTTDCNGTSVADGTNCHIRTDSLDQTEVAHCEDGQWIRGATLTDDSASMRRKRFIFFIPFIICLRSGTTVIPEPLSCTRNLIGKYLCLRDDIMIGL